MPELLLHRVRGERDRDVPLPTRATPGSAGLDVYAALAAPLVLAPGARALVPTGFALAIPAGYEAQIRPRSGLALKHGIVLPNAPATIDSDFRGELQVILMNAGQEPFTIARGDRIAQLVVAPVVAVELREVDSAAALGHTQRGEGGFGSTGYAARMIQVHHLNNSRSQRILWLLEELGVPYEIVQHTRDTTTNLAPDSLKAIHPLGKSPVIKDDGVVVIESGAICEYLTKKYGKGRLAPPEGTPEAVQYLQLLHYAEGSAMLPVMLRLYVSRLGEAGKPLEARITSELDNHLGYLNGLLGSREFFVGKELTAADINLSFVIQAARLLYGLQKFPNLQRFIDQCQARPAYKRGLEKGGTYAFG